MEEKKARKKWSTLREEHGRISVAGRQIVEKVVVEIGGFVITEVGREPGGMHYRVTIDLTLGTADENAISKAFAALGSHIAKEALPNGNDIAA